MAAPNIDWTQVLLALIAAAVSICGPIVAVLVLRIAGDAKKTKDMQAKANTAISQQLDDSLRLQQDTHTLVNSASGKLKALYAASARLNANDHPEDAPAQLAAELAEKELKDHEAQQAIVNGKDVTH